MKAEIVKVGCFNENGNPSGWHFDIGGKIPAITLKEDNNHLWAGYTVAELKEIGGGENGFKSSFCRVFNEGNNADFAVFIG